MTDTAPTTCFAQPWRRSAGRPPATTPTPAAGPCHARRALARTPAADPQVSTATTFLLLKAPFTMAVQRYGNRPAVGKCQACERSVRTPSRRHLAEHAGMPAAAPTKCIRCATFLEACVLGLYVSLFACGSHSQHRYPGALPTLARWRVPRPCFCRPTMKTPGGLSHACRASTNP
jgi:hypothetical protein